MIKEDIKNNLHVFSNDNLLENSLTLFSILGYTTKRQYKVSSIDDFKSKFLSKSFNEDKLLFKQWKNAQFLFELQPDDISSEDTTITYDKVENKIIETYWFFAIELKNESYTKKQLSDITREINKQKEIPAFILFKYGNKLTFSIIDRRINKKDSSKDVLEKVVLIKDINFIKPHRAHIDILADMSFKNIKDKFNVSNFVELHLNWLKILSISALNDKFYKDLSSWFFWMLDECKLSENNDHQSKVMFGIRMVTRIIFNWFIKEKGLIDEKVFDKQFYLNLLKPQYKKQGNLYYKVILQNLFFGCLSKPMNIRKFRPKDNIKDIKPVFGEKPSLENMYKGKNKGFDVNNLFRYEKYFNNSQDVINMFNNIPFLNGGLFECMDEKSKEKYVDCFTDNEQKNFLKIPDDIFFLEKDKDFNLSHHFPKNKDYKNAKVKGLFTILSSYKFTIDETTPIEEEVALDPELLGRVFENLLAAYNPETKTTVRKSTGSYYTPREIVDYMCEQTIINYLKTKIESFNIKNLDDKLEELLSYSERHSFKDNEIDELIKAINEVKVFDPACGSGAFPMGLLHKLVHVLQKLDPDNLKWKESQIEKANQIDDIEAREEAIKIIEKQFDDNEMDYSRKLYLIQNCIFGVDIQPMATQISRLRFFISLIVNEKINKNKENMGILPLPNLETKFVAANTLIDFSECEKILKSPDILKLKKDLENIKEKYFKANDSKNKDKLKKQDFNIRENIKKQAVMNGANLEVAAKLSQWNPYDKDKSSEWFNSQWMFGIEKFDIVIGNPPYLESRNKSFTEEMKKNNLDATKNRWGNLAIYFSKGSDLLIYFFELSLYLLKENGINAFITQNAWLDTEYGKKFQSFLSKTTEILGIIDSDYKYFDSGSGPNINTIITFLKNSKIKSNKLIFSRCKENFNKISFSLNKMKQFDKNVAIYKEYSLSDTRIQKMKWGLLLYTDEDILNVINCIFKKGKFLNSFDNVKFGQGLNLSKSLIINNEIVKNYNIPKNALIPFLSKEANFNILKTENYLINGKILDVDIKKELKKHNILTYNPNSTTKKAPILMMPRGIAGKHFCAFNKAKAFSDSYVDVYDNNNIFNYETKINLWCYFNSTLCWLIREISGRKNLGGGMLKAEAIDMSYFPCYFEFDKKEQINRIIDNISRRQVLDALDEINTQEHKEIDKIIFDYLDFDDKKRQIIVNKFKEYYIARCTKAQT